jgi:hypothetical protein
MNNQLEQLANDILNNHGKKPNLTNRDFFNCVLIFQNAVMDKMYDLQEREKMDLETKVHMTNNCGQSIHKLVKTYTNLDLHNIEDFL